MEYLYNTWNGTQPLGFIFSHLNSRSARSGIHNPSAFLTDGTVPGAYSYVYGSQDLSLEILLYGLDRTGYNWGIKRLMCSSRFHSQQPFLSSNSTLLSELHQFHYRLRHNLLPKWSCLWFLPPLALFPSLPLTSQRMGPTMRSTTSTAVMARRRETSPPETRNTPITATPDGGYRMAGSPSMSTLWTSVRISAAKIRKNATALSGTRPNASAGLGKGKEGARNRPAALPWRRKANYQAAKLTWKSGVQRTQSVSIPDHNNIWSIVTAKSRFIQAPRAIWSQWKQRARSFSWLASIVRQITRKADERYTNLY